MSPIVVRMTAACRGRAPADQWGGGGVTVRCPIAAGQTGVEFLAVWDTFRLISHSPPPQEKNQPTRENKAVTRRK